MPSEYWTVFQDACLSIVERDIRSAILSLALALEVARDDRFLLRFGGSDDPVLGPRLGPPFEGTDLLKHLTSHLASIHPDAASAERALKDAWPEVRRLYIARHHVAHGRKAVAPFEDGLRPVAQGDLTPMVIATYETIEWIEKITEPTAK